MDTTLVQIPDAESVVNAKIAAAARLYAAARIARRDAHGNPHQEAHADAYAAFLLAQERAHQALLEACADAPSASKWQGNCAEVLSWLVEVCDGPADQPDPDEPGLWPICAPDAPWTPHRYDGAKLLHCLRELPETGAITVEECEVAAPGGGGPMLRVTAVLGGWIVCLMGLWATDEAREAHPAQPMPLVAL